jgi:NAD-dependent dihydropyrimidine dehydrogenase PreA subunit
MYLVTVDIGKCQACEECVDTCAVGALAIVEEDGKKYAMFSGDPDECLGCLSCEEVCEEGAITVTEL